MRKVNLQRNQRVWGLAVIAMIAIAGIVVAYLYTSPPNRRTISFFTDDAASVRPGDTVRIAGIVVGTIKDLALENDQVHVRASVSSDAFIGDQTQVQVRMLTVVGGYYATLIPLGRAPLGNRPISKERVTMPYSLIRALTDTTAITEHVASKPIKESVDQLQQGLRGTNIESITTMLNAGNAITDTLDKQRGQLSKILNMSDEYLDRLAKYKGRLQEYLRKIAILEETLILYGKAFGDSLLGIGAIVESAKSGLTDFYFPHRDDFLEKVRGILGDLRTIDARNGAFVRVLGRLHDRIERALGRQNNFPRPDLLATDICIPVHGSPC